MSTPGASGVLVVVGRRRRAELIGRGLGGGRRARRAVSGWRDGVGGGISRPPGPGRPRPHHRPATVRNYLSNAITKVGARSRIDAIRIARNAGWSDPAPRRSAALPGRGTPISPAPSTAYASTRAGADAPTTGGCGG
jgi:hypothetical protein